MSFANVIEGQLLLDRPAKIAVVCGRFNNFIVDQLERGCLDTLVRHGVQLADVDVVRVPGAWEIPIAARKLAAAARHEAIIALGAVIRGSTPHFDHVAGACSRGLAAVSGDTGLPVVFGVLTVDSIEQAIERAGTKAGNKGADAALTAIEMISLMRRI